MRIKKPPQVVAPQLLQSHRFYDRLTPENNRALEDGQCDDFTAYMDERKKTPVFMCHPETKTYIEKPASDSSRFSHEGMEKKKKELRHRLGSYKSTHGILVTLTYADQGNESGVYDGLSRPDAWQGTGYRPRSFLDQTNKHRKRHGTPKVRGYIKVLEIQKERGYPHLHIWFPGLYFLAPIAVLQKLWPWGNVQIDTVWRNSPIDYLCKYISKMDGQTFMQVMMWANNLRLYSMSRNYRYAPKKKVVTGWRFLCSGVSLYAKEKVDQIIGEGYCSARSGIIPPPDS